MKKLVLLFGLLPLISCSDDDGNQQTSIFNGNWEMKSYAAYMPSTPELESGDVVWKINNGSLTVVNNVEDEYPYLILSGTYSISQGNATLTTNAGAGSTEWDAVLVNENELKLSDNPETDGPIIKFEKQ